MIIIFAYQEVVGRWAAQQEKELKLLVRPDGSRLFSNLTRGNHYLFQAEGYLNNSGSGQTSEMALIWNRTLPGGSVSTECNIYKTMKKLIKKKQLMGVCAHLLFSHFSAESVFLSYETKLEFYLLSF